MNHPLSFLSRARQLPWAITIPKTAPWDITVPKTPYIMVPNTPRDIKIPKKHHGILQYQINTMGYYNIKSYLGILQYKNHGILEHK